MSVMTGGNGLFLVAKLLMKLLMFSGVTREIERDKLLIILICVNG
jgi:hypothetical protein